MTRAGDFRPGGQGGRSGSSRPGSDAPPLGAEASGRRRLARGVLLALGAGLLAAAAWAVLRGILDLSVGLLVVSAAGGWVIGASLRGAPRSAGVAGGLGLTAWLASLALTWFVTRLILPGSSLDLVERLRQTTFVDYTMQQAGVLELASLVLFVAAALMSATRAAGGVSGRASGTPT